MREISEHPLTGDDKYEFERRRSLRINARNQYREWTDSTKPLESSSRAFANFMGFPDWHNLRRAHLEGDDELENKLLALNGPHGFTIYKALLARQNG